MAISFNKREKEKQKQSKRIEKQKRKEERKTSISKSFDDMIAYVDENGVITDTPQDISKKTKIDIDNILVSTPKKEDIETPILQGKVEYFNQDKGYGFIKDISRGEKYFFHTSNSPDSICQGNMVAFELERVPRGINAVNITIINTNI